MAVIAPSRFVVILLALAGTLWAQQSKAIEQQVASVGIALSSGSPDEAMACFAKSFENYGRLREYFSALTNAYHVTNELDILDEQIASQEATLTVHWTLTLTDHDGGLSETREEDLTVKLVKKKFDWLIVGITPLEFFDPERRKSRK